MPLDTLVTAAVETSFNTLISQRSESQKQLLRLKGRIVRLNLKELKKSLIFVCSHKVDVLAEFEGEADCELTLSITALRDLQQQLNINELFKQDKLSVVGDMQVGQQFAILLQLSKPDFAEILSQYIGDVAAHTLITNLKSGIQFTKQRAKRHHQHILSAITEEWKLAPSPLAVADFCDQVEETSKQFSHLEQRLMRMMEQA